MAIAHKPVPHRPGLTWFMLQRVPPLLEAFEKEIGGVRLAEDIEYIHRMRVASRRLRAALPLFRPCFPPKQYARWMAEIANITRALGEARDTDVQIAFLLKYQKKQANAWKKKKNADAPEPPTAPATRYLLSDLQKQRERLQERVISALDALEKSRAVPGLKTEIGRLAATSRHMPRQAAAHGLPALAALRIESRLRAMLSFDPWVSHPEAVAEHHATRIAAKKLRYTMEIYGPLYRLGLAKPHARVKKIQEILGDLHDCDVWIDLIVRILLKERNRFRSDADEKRPDTRVLAGMRVFLQDREKERILLHRQFMRYWESLAHAGLWDELRSTLVRGLRQRYVPAPARDDTIREKAALVAAQYPDHVLHEKQVTRLALMLFDGLEPVHALISHDRVLLEAAGLLHDIGWNGRRKNHHNRSARAIIADETLPLDIRNRIIVAVCAYAHRVKAEPEDYPLFGLLPAEEREKTLQLAAILRLADGLDYQHLSRVEEVHCVIEAGSVLCTAVASADITLEKEHARIKADLFPRAFARGMVIP